MNKFKTLLIKYSFLVLLAFIFEVVFNATKITAFENLIENILFAVLLIIPLYFIKNNIVTNFYFIFSYLFFSLCLVFETIYFYLFKTYFSSSAIFVILESNKNEVEEFFRFYIDKTTIVFVTIVLVTTCSVLIKVKRKRSYFLYIRKKYKIKLLFTFVFILLFLKLTRLIDFNVPYLVLKSNFEYYTESKKLGDYKSDKKGHFTNVLESNNKEEVHIIILGESTNRSHLGVYNYYRETTPELNKLKDSLLVYNDVISPHAYSIRSLPKILTLGNYESPDKIYRGSIIQLANSANYNTYWVSNQRPIGPYESMITKISLSAMSTKFLTTTIAGNSKVLDEEIIPELHTILKNNKKRKVIFIHLMGTHHNYENGK